MKNLNAFKIEGSANLKEAMEAVTANMRGIIFVTKNEKVIGILSDGDMRRALLRGITFLAPVSSIMRLNFAFSSTSDKNAAKKIMLEKKISAVPVMDQEMRLIDLIFIDELSNDI